MISKSRVKIPHAFYWMVIPMATAFFMLHTLSFLQGIFYSFTNWKGFGHWSFVGLRNYINIFFDSDVGASYLFTFKFAIVATILVNVISLALAMALNAKIKAQGALRTIFFLPYMLGTLVVGFIFNFIFSNILPPIGKALGIAALSTNILGSQSLAWVGILIVAVWQSTAFNTLIYLSGLKTVDPSLYESAELDGAGRWARFFKVTFPLIAPFFTINMVLCVKNFLMVFDQILAMTGGGPGTATRSISFLIYKNGFQSGQFAYQSANAVLYFIVIAAISLFQLRVLEKREAKLQ